MSSDSDDVSILSSASTLRQTNAADEPDHSTEIEEFPNPAKGRVPSSEVRMLLVNESTGFGFRTFCPFNFGVGTACTCSVTKQDMFCEAYSLQIWYADFCMKLNFNPDDGVSLDNVEYGAGSVTLQFRWSDNENDDSENYLSREDYQISNPDSHPAAWYEYAGARFSLDVHKPHANTGFQFLFSGTAYDYHGQRIWPGQQDTIAATVFNTRLNPAAEPTFPSENRTNEPIADDSVCDNISEDENTTASSSDSNAAPEDEHPNFYELDLHNHNHMFLMTNIVPVDVNTNITDFKKNARRRYSVMLSKRTGESGYIQYTLVRVLCTCPLH